MNIVIESTTVDAGCAAGQRTERLKREAVEEGLRTLLRLNGRKKSGSSEASWTGAATWMT